VAEAAKGGVEARVLALDGLRGIMTLAVVVSHYFAEVPNGIKALGFGWTAVIVFFVLSGFLVGRLILDRMHHVNFFSVFYVRRLCRTIPCYVVAVLAIFAGLWVWRDQPWADIHAWFPLWSYLTFTQNFFMISTDTIGPHWLAPTWTLQVEEIFYLVAPALLVYTPARHLLKVMIFGVLLCIGYRAAIFWGELLPTMAGRVMMPAVGDCLLIGMITAKLLRTPGIDWARHMTLLRWMPIALLVAAMLLEIALGKQSRVSDVIGTALIATASGAFILSIVLGAPEAKRLEASWLRFFGNTSYSTYMTHLAVLGVAHGLVFGTTPDIATWQQFALSIALVPLALAIGWALTRWVEEPITAYGRSWKWSRERCRRPADGATPNQS
jgi:peptidoglycan/LPS O-acetylase OafA/YrhL